jgi:hypothetical protein
MRPGHRLQFARYRGPITGLTRRPQSVLLEPRRSIAAGKHLRQDRQKGPKDGDVVGSSGHE